MVEGHAVDATVLGNIIDCDFRQGFFSSRFLSDCYKARFVIWDMVHSPLYALQRFILFI